MSKFRHFLVLLSVFHLQSSHAMLVNLARPYEGKPSSPRTAELSFFAPASETFLFDRRAPVEIACIPYQRALQIDWSLANNRVQKPLLSGTLLPRYDGAFALKPPMDQLPPGFYDLRVKAKITDQISVEGTTTFGWRIQEMQVHPACPKDFAAFWREAKSQLDAVSPEPKPVLERVLKGKEIDQYNTGFASLPENYDPPGNRFDQVEVYRVHFASYGGKTIEGWFTKPVGKGPFPSLLILPGAGNNARPAPVEHARHGYAALDIQVYGNPVDAKEYAPVPHEQGAKPEDLSHYGIYLRALQAARALKLLPGVDPARVAVLGGSQGGRLTLVVAALDPSIKAAIAGIAHFAYIPWLSWTERMNREKKSGEPGFGADCPEVTSNQARERYMDILNFAPMVQCPVLMNAGLIDPISPPTGIFAVYQRLGGSKEIIPIPNMGHDWSPAFDRHAWQWLEERLKK